MRREGYCCFSMAIMFSSKPCTHVAQLTHKPSHHLRTSPSKTYFIVTFSCTVTHARTLSCMAQHQADHCCMLPPTFQQPATCSAAVNSVKRSMGVNISKIWNSVTPNKLQTQQECCACAMSRLLRPCGYWMTIMLQKVPQSLQEL